MSKSHPLRILLAEDNSTNQQLALLTLQRLGYRADVAANGLEVVELLRRHPYDLIFMDVQMPEMDGLEATRVIRREFSHDRQPNIVAMTANAMYGDHEICLSAGMDGYISKPFKVQELVAALKKANPMGERGYVSAEQEAAHSTQNARGEKTGASEINNQQSTSTEQQTPILDPAAITRLHTILGTQITTMLPELLENFFNDAIRLQQNARQAVEQGNSRGITSGCPHAQIRQPKFWCDRTR